MADSGSSNGSGPAEEAPTASVSSLLPESDAFAALLAEYDRQIERHMRSHRALQATVQRMAEELDHKNRLLARQERLAALGEMAAGVAHEIRNPLGGISLYLEMLSKDVGHIAGAKTLCDKIGVAVGRMNRIVEAILGFTRPMEPQLASFDTSRFLDEVIGLARPDLEARKLRVNMVVEPACRTLRGDVGMLHQLALNLLRNAAEASPEQSAIRVEVCSEPEGGWVRVSVTDRGSGFAPDALERVFTPFFTTKKGGTGLGLALCQRIAEAHGGALSAANADGGGACVSLRLPAGLEERA